MNRFRSIVGWVAALIGLAGGAGCTDTVGSGAKPSKVASIEAPEDPVKTETTDKPLADESEFTLIPLHEIWGHMIPETKSIHLLEPDFFGPIARKNPEHEPPLFRQIVTAIKRRTEGKQQIGPGFAVAGLGQKALTAAKDILEQDELPPQTFPSGTEVSLFFFTRDLGMGFQLKEVKQSKEAVTIRYLSWVDPRRPIDAMSTYYFALIPLGESAVGNTAVHVIELAPKEHEHTGPYYEQRARQNVCKSFAFTIEPENRKK